MNITVARGNDGFGSQFLSILSGIVYARENGFQYYHTPLNCILLSNSDQFQNENFKEANEFVDGYIKDLGFRNASIDDKCAVHEHFHYHIYANKEDYYRDYNLDFLRSWKSIPESKYYQKGEFNIAVHIRRGTDIHKHDEAFRKIGSDVYDKVIQKLRAIYPLANIHIFCWGDPELKFKDERMFYHTVDKGGVFIEDFIALVNADVLVVGSSTFSISAGLLNKNVVICNNELMKLNSTAIPTSWKNNYTRFIGE